MPPFEKCWLRPGRLGVNRGRPLRRSGAGWRVLGDVPRWPKHWREFECSRRTWSMRQPGTRPAHASSQAGSTASRRGCRASEADSTEAVQSTSSSLANHTTVYYCCSPQPLTAAARVLNVVHLDRKNSRRQEFVRRCTMSLELSACYITWQRHLTCTV